MSPSSGMHMGGTVICMTNGMQCHHSRGGSRVPNIHTALSEACKYGIVHSQMHRFSRRLRRLPLFCKATGKLLAHMIIHGYDRCKLWLRVKRFSTRGIPRDPARRRRMFNRIRQCQEDTLAQHSNGNTWPIQHMRSDLTYFIAGQAAGHIYDVM